MKFRSDINGLRAIAVAVVLLFHFGIPGFQGGFVGVDIFFVISGYLMTGIIFTKLEKNSFFILDFYLDRMKRIIPALAVLCIILYIIGWFILLPAQYEELGKHAVSSVTFISNLIYWREAGYFDTASHSKWLLHTWSLSVEWQFYIIYPLVIVFLRRFIGIKFSKITLIVLAILSYLLSVVATKDYPEASFFLLPTRAWEMMMGGILFLYPVNMSSVQSKFCEWLGMVLIVFSVIFFTSADLWPGYLAAVPTIGTILVIAANRERSIFTNNAVAQWLGNTSYSIYLWHWPVVVILNYFYLHGDYVYIVIGIFVSLLLGSFSYAAVEKRCHHLKYEFGSKGFFLLVKNKVFIVGSCLVIIVGIAGEIIQLKGGVADRMSREIADIASQRDNNNPRAAECIVLPSSELKSPMCVFGDSQNITTIVIGDSHSNAVITAVEKSLEGIAGGALFLGTDGCFSLINTTNWYFTNCNEYNEWVENQLSINQKLHGLPIIIVNRTTEILKGGGEKVDISKTHYINGIRQGDSGYIEAFVKEYEHAVCSLTKTNPVYLMQPIAEMRVNVPEYLSKIKLLGLESRDLQLSRAAYNARHQETLEIMQGIGQRCNAELLDPVPYLCDEQVCPASIQGMSLYSDDDHLSEYGNKLLVPMFKKIWTSNLW